MELNLILIIKSNVTNMPLTNYLMHRQANDMNEKDFYNEIWTKWTHITNGPSARHRIRLITKLIKKHNLHSKILDIGCGEGNLLENLGSEYNELYGMDISTIALDNISPVVKDNITFFIGDLSKKDSLTSMKFDVIICSEVLEHIENDAAAIENLNELLNSSGHLIITVPYKNKYWTKHDEFSGHFRRYEFDEIINKLKKNGFSIIEGFSWGWPLFNIYHHVLLKNINSNIIYGKPNKFKSVVSSFLYYVFFFDDLFTHLPLGRRLFILAKKNNL